MFALFIRSLCFRLPRRRLATKKPQPAQPCAMDAVDTLAFDATQVASDMQEAGAPIWVEDTQSDGDGPGAVCRSLAADFSSAMFSEEGQVQNISALNGFELHLLRAYASPVPGFICS